MRKFITLMAAAVVAGPLTAEDHFYVGPQITYQVWDESRFITGLDDDNGVQLGLNVGYEFDSNVAFELSAQTSLSDTNAEADVYEFNSYIFFSETASGARPYLVSGISHINMDSTRVIDESTTNLVLGFGLSRYLGDFLELKTDARLRNVIGGQAPGRIVDLGLNASLNYHFGRSGSNRSSAATPVTAPTPVAVQAPIAVPVAEVAVQLPEPAPEPPQMRTVTVELDVLFATNSSVLENLNTDEFVQMAEALRENATVTLSIEGHTDSAGSAEYNESLSQRRADRVMERLISEYGAPADRVRAIGFGETQPVADNETAAGRTQNRRVVGVLSYEVAQ
jgi:OOP family OmpA-OmpF porin